MPSLSLLKAPHPFIEKAAAGKQIVPILAVHEKSMEGWLKKQDSVLRSHLESRNFTAAPGQTLFHFDAKGKLSSVLCGVSEPAGLYDFSGVADTLMKSLSATVLKKTVFRIEGLADTNDQTTACIGWGLACYRFDAYKKSNSPLPQLLWPHAADRKRAEAFVGGICLVRDLINLPANDMGPAELERAARQLSAQHEAKTSVITGTALLKNGFPLIYDVGKASTRPPRLIDLRWGNPKHPKVTIVGKGVCFDSGGLNIKPSSAMLIMKKDMAGGAHALGVASMIMALNIPVRLRVLIPAVENAISGNAYRPKDVLKSRKGISVEVGDTDAEGRLVLADALALACEEKPDLLMDFATLTGSARSALGYDIPALFSNDDSLAGDLKQAAIAAGEMLWPMPLWQPYKKEMSSDIADCNSTGSGPAGAIHGALFLDNFVDSKIPWIHLDMYAWEQTGKPGRPRGGADTGLRASFTLIENRYGRKEKRGKKK